MEDLANMALALALTRTMLSLPYLFIYLVIYLFFIIHILSLNGTVSEKMSFRIYYGTVSSKIGLVGL